MDEGTLVETQIQDGTSLVDQLIRNGVSIAAACWMKESEGGGWYFYLVTPLVGRGGDTLPAYRRINQVIRALPEALWIDPFQIKAVGPSEAIGQAILDLQRRYSRRLPARVALTSLGGVEIQEVYLYPPLVEAIGG
jgi:hypothetical protein